MVDWTRKRRMVVSCGSQTGTAEEFTSRLAKEGARYFNTRQYNHKVLEDGEKPLLLSGNHSTARVIIRSILSCQELSMLMLMNHILKEVAVHTIDPARNEKLEMMSGTSSEGRAGWWTAAATSPLSWKTWTSPTGRPLTTSSTYSIASSAKVT